MGPYSSFKTLKVFDSSLEFDEAMNKHLKDGWIVINCLLHQEEKEGRTYIAFLQK